MNHQTNDPISRPRVTVAAVVENHGKFLFVEELDNRGRVVLNQPAGHVEGGESIEEALVREAFEETGWQIEPISLVGIYLCSNQDRTASYLRIAMSGRAIHHDKDARLDEGILRPIWLSPEELADAREIHRSPMVMRCVEDFITGEKFPLSVIKSLLV